MTCGVLGGPAQKTVLKILLNAWFALFLIIHGTQIVRLFADQELGDFIAFLTAARLVQSQSFHALYDIPTQQGIQQGIKGYKVFLAYYHPPFEALVFRPLALLSDFSAYKIWFLINLGLFAWAMYRLFRILDLNFYAHPFTWLLGILSFYPLALSLVQGQDSILLFLLISSAFIQLKKGHEARAGVLYALGLFKPHFLIPFIIPWVRQRRWRALAAFCLTAAALGLLSLALVGAHGGADYLNILRAISQHEGLYGSHPKLMLNLRGLYLRWLGPTAGSQALSWLTSGLLLLTLWRIWRGRSEPQGPLFDLQYAYTVILALLLSPHLNGHDLLLLVLPVLLIAAYIGAAEPVEGRHRMHITNLLVATVLLLILAPLWFITAPNLSVVSLLLLALALWMEVACLRDRPQGAPRDERTAVIPRRLGLFGSSKRVEVL